MLDHTSVVKFLELRFDVHCPNISPWRRAVAGDLTSAFNFSHPDYTWPPLPDTSDNVNKSTWECKNLPGPVVPAEQAMPTQEPGTRLARPLPYRFNITAVLDPTTSAFNVNMQNLGSATGVFMVLDKKHLRLSTPRTYTVEPGKELVDSWQPSIWDGKESSYDLLLYGGCTR